MFRFSHSSFTKSKSHTLTPSMTTASLLALGARLMYGSLDHQPSYTRFGPGLVETEINFHWPMIKALLTFFWHGGPPAPFPTQVSMFTGTSERGDFPSATMYSQMSKPSALGSVVPPKTASVCGMSTCCN